MGQIHIGTSGWHYKHWVGPFYPPRTPASKMLPYYFQHFDTVELNNTFYRLPQRGALENWRDSTPEHFCFAAKGSRFLTHRKKLKDPEQGLGRYFEAIEILEHKLGPILFQLPPNWEVDACRFETFLRNLRAEHRYAFEFRNPSWNCSEILQLLEQFRAAYCIYHLAGYQSPLEITADFVYVRLHGPGGRYQGSYSDQELGFWADHIMDWKAHVRAVYVYFDNDDTGYAVRDALRLRELVTH